MDGCIGEFKVCIKICISEIKLVSMKPGLPAVQLSGLIETKFD